MSKSDTSVSFDAFDLELEQLLIEYAAKKTEGAANPAAGLPERLQTKTEPSRSAVPTGPASSCRSQKAVKSSSRAKNGHTLDLTAAEKPAAATLTEEFETARPTVSQLTKLPGLDNAQPAQPAVYSPAVITSLRPVKKSRSKAERRAVTIIAVPTPNDETQTAKTALETIESNAPLSVPAQSENKTVVPALAVPPSGIVPAAISDKAPSYKPCWSAKPHKLDLPPEVLAEILVDTPAFAQPDEDLAAIVNAADTSPEPAPKPTQISKKRRVLTAGVCAAIILITTLLSAMTLTLRRYTIAVGDGTQIVYAFSTNPYAALTKAGIPYDENDLLDVAALTPLSTFVTFTPMCEVTLIADGHTGTVLVPSGTACHELLANERLILGELDTISLPPESLINEDTTLQICRVEIREETYEEEISFETKDISNPDLGTETLTGEGTPGLRRVTAIRKYVDGIITEVTELSSEVLTQPKASVTYSIQPIKGVGSERPEQYAYSFIGEATAYTGIGGTTATGKLTQWGYVAVDPKVIPLGTRMYIESLDGTWAYGYCEAQDVGGAVKGNIVDLFMYTYDDCINWGRRAVRIYILED